MKFFSWEKDGGNASSVHGLFIIEIKSLFSIVLLRFNGGTREAYHSHAFNACSWVLSGLLREYHMNGTSNYLNPSWRPVYTYRDTYHKVYSFGRTWALSFRGPWAPEWKEYYDGEEHTLTHGRVEVDKPEIV